MIKTFFLTIFDSMYTHYKVEIEYKEYGVLDRGYYFTVYSNDGSSILLHTQLIEPSQQFSVKKLDENYKIIKEYLSVPNNFIESEYDWYINSFEGDIYDECGWFDKKKAIR